MLKYCGTYDVVLKIVLSAIFRVYPKYAGKGRTTIQFQQPVFM